MPSCPHCGSVLFEVESLEAWYSQCDKYPEIDYKAALDWVRGKCSRALGWEEELTDIIRSGAEPPIYTLYLRKTEETTPQDLILKLRNWAMNENIHGYNAKILEAAANLIEEYSNALVQTDHFIVISDTGWSVEHLIDCRPNMTACKYHQKSEEIFGHAYGGYMPTGRYKIASLDPWQLEDVT